VLRGVSRQHITIAARAICIDTRALRIREGSAEAAPAVSVQRFCKMTTGTAADVLNRRPLLD